MCRGRPGRRRTGSTTFRPSGHVRFLEENRLVARKRLEALQPQISHLVDLTPQEPNRRRFWQQGEVTSAITRMQDQRIALTLQPHQMLTLANATHNVTHNLGRSLRLELLRPTATCVTVTPVTRTGRYV